jgi:uncharacterized repeat protein (TIGR01451 family)
LGTPNGTNLINALAVSVNPITHISPPPPPYGTNMAAMNGSNPNGTWSLFIQDDTAFGSGVISNGWILALTTANPVGGAADNQLLMTASSANIAQHGLVAFYLTVTNYGPSTATNVLVSDSYPMSFTTVSNSSTVGSLSPSGFTVVWNVGTLTNSAGGQAKLVMRANSLGSFNNSASVSAGTPDPNPADASVSASITVGAATPPNVSGSLVNNHGAFQLAVTSPTGQSGLEYIVQASTNLSNWVPVYTNPWPYVLPFTYTNSSAASYPAQFYRVVGVVP